MPSISTNASTFPGLILGPDYGLCFGPAGIHFPYGGPEFGSAMWTLFWARIWDTFSHFAVTREESQRSRGVIVREFCSRNVSDLSELGRSFGNSERPPDFLNFRGRLAAPKSVPQNWSFL